MLWHRFHTENDRHRYHQCTTVHGGIRQPDSERREGFETLRLGKMLVSQREESMISRYEQILAGDMCLVIEWRPMRFHLRRETIPGELYGVGDNPPGGQCPAMHVQMLQLARSTDIDGVRTLPGIALVIPMIPGGIACGTVSVTDEYGWTKLGHSLSLQVLG